MRVMTFQCGPDKFEITISARGDGVISSKLPRLGCPVCRDPACYYCCGGLGPGDKPETEESSRARFKHNGFLDGLESGTLGLVMALWRRNLFSSHHASAIMNSITEALTTAWEVSKNI